MNSELIVDNHQSVVAIPERWLLALESCGGHAVTRILAEFAADQDSPLHHLASIEVALVDEVASDRVHREFMEIPGATDVITFHHGEIVICTEVARRQAAEYGEPLSRELLRYLIHGLLHLAGHDDQQPTEQTTMETAQESLIAELWASAECSHLHEPIEP